MKTKLHSLLFVLVALATVNQVAAQGTAFTYQGELQNDGVPANGSYDLEFTLYSTNGSGAPVSATEVEGATPVSNGLFTVTIDFGAAFTGTNYWLEIGVRTNGSSLFNILSPRQALTPAPYAIYSTAAGSAALAGSVAATNLTGSLSFSQLPSGLVTNGGTADLSGVFFGNGSGITNISGATAISGAITVQNPLVLTLVTNNASNPFSGTNWQAITMTSQPSLTNSPSVAIYRGYPANVKLFGYLPALCGSTVSNQGPEMRVVIHMFGNQLGLYTGDAGQNYWWRTDGSAWAVTNVGNAGNNIFWSFNWPTYGMHEFEFDYGVSASAGLAGVYIPATNAFLNAAPPRTTAVVIGDSITDGAAGYGGEQLWVAQLQDILFSYGINIIPQGEGGTGYTTTGGTTGAVFSYRLTNYIANYNPKPDMIIWAGGINDQSTSNLLFAAETNCFGLCQLILPNAKQIVIAPFNDSEPADGDSIGINLITSNAAAVYGLPVIYPQYSLASSWMSGYYNVPGSGNAPLFETGNGPHPTVLGHQFIADMVANFVLTNVLTKINGGGFSGTVTLASATITNLSVQNLSGNGGGLTNLSASQITGNISVAQLPATLVTNGGNATLSGVFIGDGSGLTNLYASQITSGIISDNVLPGFQGDDNALGGGSGNIFVSASQGTIGGGLNNTNSGNQATVGGGYGNYASGNYPTIAGGFLNVATGAYSVAAGYENQAFGISAVVAGGGVNLAGAGAENSDIAGGANNEVTQPGAAIGGGYFNTNNGNCATIPGGYANLASGSNSFAAGANAQATNDSAFVWSDGSATTASSTSNSVTMRASGGYWLFSGAANTTYAYLAPGSGSWTSLSDRHAKENFAAVNPSEVLERVANLAVSTWNYKTQPASVRHIGPTAQDFKAAFAVGETDTGISTVDEGGVALAAIQGLNQKVAEKEAQIQEQAREIAGLKARLDKLERLMEQSNAGKL